MSKYVRNVSNRNVLKPVKARYNTNNKGIKSRVIMSNIVTIETTILFLQYCCKYTFIQNVPTHSKKAISILNK